MSELWQYVLVFVTAAVPMLELAVVIPAGVAAGLSPAAVGILAFCGNLFTVGALVYGADGVLRRRRARAEPRLPRRSSARARRLMERFGVPTLVLAGPVTTGSHVAAAVALGMRTRPATLMGWTTASLALWAALATVASVAGFGLLGIG